MPAAAIPDINSKTFSQICTIHSGEKSNKIEENRNMPEEVEFGNSARVQKMAIFPYFNVVSNEGRWF